MCTPNKLYHFIIIRKNLRLFFTYFFRVNFVSLFNADNQLQVKTLKKCWKYYLTIRKKDQIKKMSSKKYTGAEGWYYVYTPIAMALFNESNEIEDGYWKVYWRLENKAFGKI